MQALRSLEDFDGILRELLADGFELAVIGGCAVGAYGRLRGEAVFTRDLDFLVTPESLPEVLQWAAAHGVEVVKPPQPRNVPVAVLAWEGKEVNVLTWSAGLPDARVVLRTAREVELRSRGGLVVPIADPFDLLANKLAVRREKDLPHVEVLRRFVEEEVVEAFESETGRQRLLPARRLLEVLETPVLPEPLAARVVELAREPVDFRFLLGRVPSRELGGRLVARCAELHPEMVEELEGHLARRWAEPG